MPPDETIDAMREAKLQAKLDHIGVVKCFNNFLDKDFFCIISEYCNVSFILFRPVFSVIVNVIELLVLKTLF